MRPMFLIPTGTDRDDGRRPWVAWSIMLVCVGVHLFSVKLPEGSSDDLEPLVKAKIMEVFETTMNEGDPAVSEGEEAAARRAQIDEIHEMREANRTAMTRIGTLEWFATQPDDLRFLFTFGAVPDLLHWWQPLTSQFLHGGWLHLIMNMFFLAAFGVVLESRLGRLGFLALFLAGGAFAALTQAWVGSLISSYNGLAPIIGASGSISALMGAAFALHPRANVSGIAIPQFVRAQTSLRWMMAFAVALDIARTIVDWTGGGHSGIATLAHLGGLVCGFAVGAGLLATGILQREDVDALYLFKQWRRRREIRAALEGAGSGAADGPVAARVRAGGASAETDSQRRLRNTIAAAHRERDFVLASQLYLELLQSLPDATLPAQIQLDVANQLASDGKNLQAASAYTRFLERFRTHVSSDDVRIMLAVIQARRLFDKSAARATLDGFGGRELDRDRQALINTLRGECA